MEDRTNKTRHPPKLGMIKRHSHALSRSKIFPSNSTIASTSTNQTSSVPSKRKPLLQSFSSNAVSNNIGDTVNTSNIPTDSGRTSLFKRPTLPRRETSFTTSSIYQSSSSSIRTRIFSVIKSIFTSILFTLLAVSSVSVFVSVSWLGVAIYNAEQTAFNMRGAAALSSSFEIFNHLERPRLVSGSLTGLFLNNHTSEDEIFGMLNLFSLVLRENLKHQNIGTDIVLIQKDTYLGFYRSNINESLFRLVATWPGIENSTRIEARENYLNTYEVKKLSPLIVEKTPLYQKPFSYPALKKSMMASIPEPTLQFLPPKLQECLNISECQYVLPYVSLPMDIDNGMLLSHIRLTELSNELAKLLPFDGKYSDSILITRNESYLLADTFNGKYDVPIDKRGFRPMIASEHIYYGIKQIALTAQDMYGKKYEKLNSGTAYNRATLNSTVYYFDCTLIQFPGLEIIHITTIPGTTYKVILGITGAIITIISLVSVLSSMVFACVTSYIITKPLKQLVRDFEGIYQKFDMNVVKLDYEPYFTEFKDLHKEFSDLVERLALYRTFLPDHIVHTMDSSVMWDMNDTFLIRQEENQRHNLQVISAYGQYQKKHFTPSDMYDMSIDEPPMMVATTNENSTQDETEGFRSELVPQASHIPVQSLALGVSKENATFLCIYIKYKDTKNVSANMSTYTNIMNTTAKVTRVKSGHIEQFDGESILVSFNSIAPASNHIRNAALIAMNISKQFNQFPLRGVNGPGGFQFGIGISTGTIFKGNIGSKFKRTWNSLGEPVDNAMLCAKHAVVLKLNICIDISVRSKIKRPIFQMRCVDILITRPNSQFFIYELKETIVESKSRRSQRWFFDLDKKKSNVPAQQWAYYYRLAFSSLVEDDCEGSLALMKRHILTNSKDQMALQLLGLIQYILREPLSWPLFLEDFYDRHELIIGTDYVSIIHYEHYPIQELERLDAHYHHNSTTKFEDNSDWSTIMSNYELSSDYSLKLNHSILKAHRMPSRKIDNTPIETPDSDSSSLEGSI